MPFQLIAIYFLLALPTGSGDTLPTPPPTTHSSPQPSANETYPTLPPITPPTILSELTIRRSILLSLLRKGLSHEHPRAAQNSTSTSTATHVLCDPAPTSSDLIEILAGTNRTPRGA